MLLEIRIVVEFSRTQESQEWEPKVVFRGGRHVLGLDKGEEQIGKKKKKSVKNLLGLQLVFMHLSLCKLHPETVTYKVGSVICVRYP